MLAVIEDEEHALGTEVPGNRIFQRFVGCLDDVKRRRERIGNVPAFAQRGECDKVDAAGVILHDLGGDLQREPRFADAARPANRNDAILGEPVPKTRDLTLAPDEARDLRGQIIRVSVDRRKCGKVWTQAFGHHLIGRFGPPEIFETVRAQMAQHHALERNGRQHLGNRGGQQNLASMANRQQTCDAVEGRSEIVAVVCDRIAAMQRHPDADLADFPRPAVGLQRAHRFDCCGEPVGRALERTAKLVADGFENVSGVPFEDATQEAIVIRERSGHRIGVLLPRTGATLDVSKEKGYRSFRERPFEHVAAAPRFLRCA